MINVKKGYRWIWTDGRGKSCRIEGEINACVGGTGKRGENKEGGGVVAASVWLVKYSHSLP